jgi:hypothetical protein
LPSNGLLYDNIEHQVNTTPKIQTEINLLTGRVGKKHTEAADR